MIALVHVLDEYVIKGSKSYVNLNCVQAEEPVMPLSTGQRKKVKFAKNLTQSQGTQRFACDLIIILSTFEPEE